MTDRDYDEPIRVSSNISVASERTLDNLSALTSPVQSPKHQAEEMNRNLGPDYQPGSSRPPHHQGRQDQDERWQRQDYDRSPGHYGEGQHVHRVQVSPDGVENNTTEFSFEYKDGAAVESPRHRQDMTRVLTGR